MALQMSEPNRELLRAAPIGLVICQINLPDAEVKIASKELFSFRDLLNVKDGTYGELTQIRKGQLTVQLGAFGGATTSDTSASSGWRLANRDQSWSVSIFSDSIALESRVYGGWSDSFRPRLDSLISATIATFAPNVETRLGLRYVNALSNEDATSPQYWIGKVTPAFLGALADDELRNAVTGSATRVQCDFEDAQATVSLGFQPDIVHAGRTAVAIDIDIFRAGAREFSAENLMNTADIFNTRALQLFQHIITADFLTELR